MIKYHKHLVYYHQITIHGEFDFFERLRVNGYKSIIQNKNKSIGVKYVAIDSGKKKIISKYLHVANWQTVNNSQEFFYIKTSEYCQNLEDIKKYYAEFLALKEKIDTSLFNGGVYVRIYKSPFYGYFLAVELYINTIPQENVTKAIENITSRTITDIDTENAAKAAQEAIEQAARDKEYELQKQQAADKAAQVRKEVYSTYKTVINPLSGAYVKLAFDYSGKPMFYKVEFKANGNQLLRRSSFSFDTIEQAKAYNFTENFKKVTRKAGIDYKYITLEV